VTYLTHFKIENIKSNTAQINFKKTIVSEDSFSSHPSPFFFTSLERKKNGEMFPKIFYMLEG
jgi:hypothetical protein